MGPAARRRQPVGAGDAGGHPRRGRRRRLLHPQGEEQGGRRPPDGLGHRVYKNSDPRAKIIKAAPRTTCSPPSASPTSCWTSP
ncbi:hypothetical protein LV779_03300 [Streptomyces thinghirensis]|nr:hypothetical protein [Streptomyces thinghirensis]